MKDEEVNDKEMNDELSGIYVAPDSTESSGAWVRPAWYGADGNDEVQYNIHVRIKKAIKHISKGIGLISEINALIGAWKDDAWSSPLHHYELRRFLHEITHFDLEKALQEDISDES